MAGGVRASQRVCAQHDVVVCAASQGVRAQRDVAVLTAWRWVFYFVIPRVSRGIQQPRAQSVLQAFLDAATARSMTWWFVRYGVGSRRMTWWFVRYGRGRAGIAEGVRAA